MKRPYKLALILLASALSVAPVATAELRPDCDKKGRWGYVDENGNIAVRHRFSGVTAFDDGVAHVLDGKKYGVIDLSGDYVLKPDYDFISPFNEYGLARVTKGDKNGFVNRKGEFVIPMKYNFTGEFNSEGIVWVNRGGNIKKGENYVTGGEFRLLRADGSDLLDAPYAVLGFFRPYKYTYSEARKEKMTSTERRLTEGASYVYWKRIRYAFVPGRAIEIPETGLWACTDNSDTGNGVFAKDGSVVIPADKYTYAILPSDGIAVVYTSERQANYLDMATGQLILDSPLESSWAFKDGFAIGKYRGLMYIYDRKGHQCSDGYTLIYPANNGMHVVRNGSDKYGLISASGKEVLAPSNYAVYPFIGGASLVKTASRAKAGYIGADGRWLIEPAYNNGLSFNDKGMAKVSIDNKWGYIDKTGRILVPIEFYDVSASTDKAVRYCWIKRDKDSLFELFDISEGKTALPAAYANACAFDEACDGCAVVTRDKGKDKWGVIDLGGRTIIPFEYTAELAIRAAREYAATGRGEWTDYRNHMFRLRHNSKPVDLAATVGEDYWDY